MCGNNNNFELDFGYDLQIEQMLAELEAQAYALIAALTPVPVSTVTIDSIEIAYSPFGVSLTTTHVEVTEYSNGDVTIDFEENTTFVPDSPLSAAYAQPSYGYSDRGW